MDDRPSSSPPSSPSSDDSSASTAHPLVPTTPSLARPLTTPSSYIPATPQPFLPSINHLVHMPPNAFDTRLAMLSPPEQAPLDFSRSSGKPTMDYTRKGPMPNSQGRLLAPLSPPISPETKTISPTDPLRTSPTRDPILFSPIIHVPPSQQHPLFPPSRLIDQHIQARESNTFKATSPPQSSDYELALSFKSQVAYAFNLDRKRWRQRETAQLRSDALLKNGGRRYTTIAPAHAGGVRQVRAAPKVPRTGTAHRVAKPARAPKPAPGRGGTPNGEVAKRVAREDKDFESLQDFCPALSTLPNKPNSLKVDWKGAPIDLKSDPHAYLLHPDEIHLAANLRLDCATYLTSKRRIFIKRIEAYRINKEFRKTDAQQACKIDVNKASKLWQAFDKVGWLHPKYIQEYV